MKCGEMMNAAKTMCDASARVGRVERGRAMGYGKRMDKRMRIVLVVVGAFFLLQALRWVVDPAGAAQSLGLTLPGGLARSTVIGDLGAFFLGASTFILLGAATRRAHWLRAGALLFGAAAVLRGLAWALHGAELAGLFIVVELAVAGLLLGVSRRLG